ncbi:hypothetical protein FRC02_002337 [Tulasnella sp. 418]|nr:hypothetical protein FRC02_002337 [Tulasnella sp. 418]
MVALSNLMSKHGGHPFPNLRFISFWSISFEEGHMFPMCCFSSNLRSVVASNAVQDSEGRNYNYLFEVLKNHCPDIEELALPQQIMPVNIASLSFFQGLKCLKYDGQLSPYILMSIAQCDTLRSLSLTSSYLPGPMAVNKSPSNALMELEALPWLASSAKHTMPNLEEIDLGVVSFNTDSATTTLLRSKLLFPSLKRVYLTDWGRHSLPWLEQLLEGNPSITQVRITIRTILHLPLIDCLLKYRNMRRIHLSESGHRIDGSPGDHLHSWLASMPWLEAFEWTVADHAYTARLLGIPNLTTLSQLIFGHPRLQELAMPFDPYQPPTKTKSSLFSLGKSIIKSNPPRLDDHRHQSSTSLRSLQLFLFNNRLEDVPKTFKALVDIVPEQVELTILVTPMWKSQLFMDAECERSIAAEAQFRRLLETDRREKQ